MDRLERADTGVQARGGTVASWVACQHRDGWWCQRKIREGYARLRDGDAIARAGASDSETAVSNCRRRRGGAQQRTVIVDQGSGSTMDDGMDEGCDKLGRHEWHDIGMHRTIQRLAVRLAVRMAQGRRCRGLIAAACHMVMITSRVRKSPWLHRRFLRHTRTCVCSDSKLHEQYADQHEQCRKGLGCTGKPHGASAKAVWLG